jgi:hypothetical protein
MGENLTVTIPESHGMPEAKLNLVREAGDFKIDLPDSMDAQTLTQKLQQQLDECAQKKDQWPQDPTEAARAISHSVFIAFSDAQGIGTSGTHGSQGATGAGSGSDATGGSSITAPGTSDPGTSGQGAGGLGASGQGAGGPGTSGQDPASPSGSSGQQPQ